MSGTGESYTCERCGGTFTKGWSDEEALTEAQDLFPAAHIAEPADQATVCDPCFREIMAWAEVSAPDLLRDPPAGVSDPIAADTQAAREEIRTQGLICPSCGHNWADLIGHHNLILIMTDDTPWCECRDGAQVLLGSLLTDRIGRAKAWEKMKAAANIALADEVWRQETIAFDRDIIGTSPADFTGLLSILEQP